MLGLLGMVLVATVWWFWRTPADRGVDNAPVANRVAEETASAAPIPSEHDAAKPTPTPAISTSEDWETLAAEGADAYAIASHCLIAAKQGDGRAMWCLYLAHRDCESPPGAGSDRYHSKRAELQVAIDDPATKIETRQSLEQRLARCGALWDSGSTMGSADDWLQKAVAAHDPEAQYQVATGVVPHGQPVPLAQRKDLLKQAWLSGSPEVLASIEAVGIEDQFESQLAGETVIPDANGLNPEQRGFAVLLAMCVTPSQCSRTQQLVRQQCAQINCAQGTSLQDYFRSQVSPAQFEAMLQYGERVKRQVQQRDTNWPALQAALGSLTGNASR